MGGGRVGRRGGGGGKQELPGPGARDARGVDLFISGGWRVRLGILARDGGGTWCGALYSSSWPGREERLLQRVCFVCASGGSSVGFVQSGWRGGRSLASTR